MAGRAPLLLHVFSTFAVGGQQMRFVALAAAFGSRYRHIVMAMDNDHACAARLAPGLDVCCEHIAVAKGATFSNVLRFRRRLRAIAPDVLVTYNWGAIEWAMANIPRRVRHIHVEDGFGPEERERQLPRRVLTRRLVLARSTVAVPSRTLWRIATEVWRLDPHRVRYVPNGIDLARFAGSRETGGEPVIGTVAALRPEKNLARLLRAFRLVADVMPVRLVIAGDGPERAGLERLSRDLGLSGLVRFTGHLDDPAALYRGLGCVRAVVGYRADAVVGDRGDGVRPAGRRDRRSAMSRRCWRRTTRRSSQPWRTLLGHGNCGSGARDVALRAGGGGGQPGEGGDGVGMWRWWPPGVRCSMRRW